MNNPTHYQRLGVHATAGVEEIRAAYRAQARRAHPDASGVTAGAHEDMAALNEAWRVLSDPARRARYDASLRPVVTPPRPTVRDEAVIEAPVIATGTGRFPKWPFVLLFVLAAIFIFTSGALRQSPVSLAPNNLLVEGSCVTVLPNGDAAEVECSTPHDATVVTVVGFDQRCPTGSQAHRDRQGRGYACLAQ
jgi:hypothetical protein